MISLKDYAKNKGVSYEAVRKQVSRYREELEGHIQKVNRTQYLDDEAVAFLDAKRQENPIVIYEVSKDEEIQRLTDENKALLIKLAEANERLAVANERVNALRDEKEQLLADKIALLEAKQEKQEEPEKKSWWQRIWK